MKIKLEYVWLDGYTPEPNLRSKVKLIDAPTHDVNGKKVHGIGLNVFAHVLPNLSSIY